MMPFDMASFEITGWFFLKIAAIIGMAMYIVFAVVVTKQVGIMTKTLEVNFERPLRIVAKIHLVFAVLVFLYSVIM